MSDEPTLSYDELITQYKVGTGPWSWDDEAALHHSLVNSHTQLLRAEIEQAGEIRNPVTVEGDRVVDGHHRVTIAGKLGIPIPVRHR